MKYILCSDYDGTLCQKGIVDKCVSEKIDEFRNSGNIFVVVSGRCYPNGYKWFKENANFAFDYILNSNGAYACDNNGNAVYSKYVDADMLIGNSRLVQVFLERCMSLTKNNCIICDEKSMLIFHHDHLSGGNEYNNISDVDKIHRITSVHLVCDTVERSLEVCKALKDEFGEFFNPSCNGYSIDVTPNGVDKATGIQNLIESIGIGEDCVWTIGDNLNDLTMVEKYHGCAIKTGVDKLKDVAEYECGTVGDAVDIILGNI